MATIAATAVASADAVRAVVTDQITAGRLVDGNLVDGTPATRTLVERLTVDSTRAGDSCSPASRRKTWGRPNACSTR
ncbi:hypothetical protein ACWEOE_33565 [Amycolatopsis sp. NPDC004368]